MAESNQEISQNYAVKQAPFNIQYELLVLGRTTKDENLLLQPQEGVTLDRSPDLAPAKLSFKVYKDDVLNISEGQAVQFKVNFKVVFVGYIFEKKRTKDNFIEVTCYDQCRYLKSEGYYVFDGTKTASELIMAITQDIGVKTKDIAPTTIKIDRVFDGKTYMDIILTMLMETTNKSPLIEVKKIKNTNLNQFDSTQSKLISWGNETKDTKKEELAPNGKPYEQNDIQYLMNNHYTREEAIKELAKSDKYKDKNVEKRKPLYVAYDDCGYLTVKELNDMVTDILIDSSQVSDYEYISSIDKNTFTQMIVVREAGTSGKDGKKEWYRTGMAKADEQIVQWGVLQKVLKPGDKDIDAIALAKAELEAVAKKTHTLRLKDCLGNIDIRPGSGIWLNFNIGDQVINELVYVQAVTHNFSHHKHLMDLDIIYYDKQTPVVTTQDDGDAKVRAKLIADKKKHDKQTAAGTGSGPSSNNPAPAQVQAGFDAVEGTVSPYGGVGCVDRASLIGSYYNKDIADAYNQGIKRVPEFKELLASRGYAIEAYNGQANPGDILVYDYDEHVVVADGNGGCVGNSSGEGYTKHYPDLNYAYGNGVAPTHVIRTGIR